MGFTATSKHFLYSSCFFFGAHYFKSLKLYFFDEQEKKKFYFEWEMFEIAFFFSKNSISRNSVQYNL